MPNLFTLAALFGGFYSVVMAMNGRFDMAAVGVFCAMVLDSLDGRVARMTNTQSAFGEQMDSLSDMVSFGAAPALIAYEWALAGFGQLGVDCCVCLLCLRCVASGSLQCEYRGRGQALLPGPAISCGCGVGGWLYLADDRTGVRPGEDSWFSWSQITWIMFAFTLYAGLTMVTNVPFYSFKDVQMKRSVPFAAIVLMALVIAVINIHPPIVLFGIFVLYGMSGYGVYAWRKAKGQHSSVISISTDEPDERGLHK